VIPFLPGMPIHSSTTATTIDAARLKCRYPLFSAHSRVVVENLSSICRWLLSFAPIFLRLRFTADARLNRTRRKIIRADRAGFLF
jgi:hypothetical protein